MMNPIIISNECAISLVQESDLFVFACGYEQRSHLIPTIPDLLPNRAVVGVYFRKGPEENLRGAAIVTSLLDRAKNAGILGIGVEFDPFATRDFEDYLIDAVHDLQTLSIGRICIDISGMPQFMLMEVLGATREVFSSAKVDLVYVAAKSYPPKHTEIKRFLHSKETGKLEGFRFKLSFMPGDTLFPKRFGGVGQRRGSSVMILCAGYEKDRSHAAYDAINPTKLVLLHSRPAVDGSSERLAYSMAVHEGLGGNIQKSVEVIDNTDVVGHTNILRDYYHWLYDVYDFVIVPVHSKLQTVACFLFWEQFRDVQVIFPVPVSYTSGMGGLGVGEIFHFELPNIP